MLSTMRLISTTLMLIVYISWTQNCTNVVADRVQITDILPENLQSYDKMRPPRKGDKATTVHFHVTVMGLDSIDENSMTYAADIFFAQTWKDHRLRLPENMTSEYRLLDVAWLKDIWRPDSFFKNAKSVIFQTMTIPNHYMWLYNDKTILYMVKLTLKLSCAMNFLIYPHDTQFCKLQMESLSHTTKDLIFEWDPAVPLVVDENIELPQLELVQNYTADCSQTYSTGNFTCLEVIFVLKRRLGYYLFHTYIPTCLIVIMSWISFWIKPEAAPARVTLGVTSLLTLSTQHAKSQAALPPVSYIKAVDAFMSVCTIFVFMALMEYCMVNIALGDDDGPKPPPPAPLPPPEENGIELLLAQSVAQCPRHSKRVKKTSEKKHGKESATKRKKIISIRVLKKLSLENDFEIKADATDPKSVRKKKTDGPSNLFDLLQEDNASESEIVENPHDSNDADSVPESSKASKNSKRKKKRRHHPNRSRNSMTKEEEDFLTLPTATVDTKPAEIKRNQLKVENGRNLYHLAKELELLRVNPNRLNPGVEFSRLFGPDKSLRYNKGKRRMCRTRQMRQNLLVTPLESWFKYQRNELQMLLWEETNGIKYFKFMHSGIYQDIQHNVIMHVEHIGRLENMEELLTGYPFHVECLMQCAEVSNFYDAQKISYEFIQQAVYAYERSFHPAFDVSKGNVRLDYSYQENRPFYVLMLKYAAFAARQSCHKSAFELCKMLMSLSPLEDPVAVVLNIDHYAIMAKEYEWFIEFVQCWDPLRNLLMLPNYRYSMALAYWHLKNNEEADKCLLDAMVRFPGIVPLLFEQCNFKKVLVLEGEVFQDIEPRNSPLYSLQAMYVKRCFAAWKQPELAAWLSETAQKLNEQPNLHKEAVSERRKWRRMRLPVNIKRNLHAHGMTDLIGYDGLENPSMFSFDPYPPFGGVDIYPTDHHPIQSADESLLGNFLRALNPMSGINGTDHVRDAVIPNDLQVSRRNMLIRIFQHVRDIMNRGDINLGSESDSSSDSSVLEIDDTSFESHPNNRATDVLSNLNDIISGLEASEVYAYRICNNASDDSPDVANGTTTSATEGDRTGNGGMNEHIEHIDQSVSADRNSGVENLNNVANVSAVADENGHVEYDAKNEQVKSPDVTCEVSNRNNSADTDLKNVAANVEDSERADGVDSNGNNAGL